MSEHWEPARAVVDTNLFVSGAIGPYGSPRRLLRAWISQRFLLLLSNDHQDEPTDVLHRRKLVALFQMSPTELAALNAGLAAAERVTPSPSIPVPLRDAKDVKILAAALGGNADYLVAGDDDLLVLRGDPRLGNLKIVTVAMFLAILVGLSEVEVE